MRAKTEAVTISLPKEVRARVKEEAAKQGRTFSNMVLALVLKGIEIEKAA